MQARIITHPPRRGFPAPRRAGRARGGLLAASLVALAGCGGGGGAGGGVGGGTGPPLPGPTGPVTISGKAQYQLPPPRPNCLGLDFGAVGLRPIRQATVELLAAANDVVLDSAVTDDTGAFSLTAEPETSVYIRVRAELKRTGTPSWDVEVRDNTATESSTGVPLDLPQRPLYVLDSAVFDSGTIDITRDVTAATGWNSGTNSYSGKRSAAPFAVLDVAYSGILLVLGADPQAAFEPLDMFWSVNNRPGGTNVNIGEIGTSHYRPGAHQLFLLGEAQTATSDPDEFDDHVVAHEWGHYYEDTFSRSDSIGGGHGPGDLLDMRVAFGEGWATALSGMTLDNPLYCDTTLSSGFAIDIESAQGGLPGWFNEISVMGVVYDLWDENQDIAEDTGSVGFTAIHQVMTGAQAATPAFTSIFSFASALRDENPAEAPLIDALLQSKAINAGGDAFGDPEDNTGGAANGVDVLPVYLTVAPDAVTREVCSSSEFDRAIDDDDPVTNELFATGNKLAEHRFLRMTIQTAAQYHFEIITTNTDLPPDDPNDNSDQSDPDLLIVFRGDQVNVTQIDCDGDGDVDQSDQVEGFCPTANQEIFTTSNALQPGEYVMALTEFRYHDEQAPPDYPARTCFDVTITQAP